MLRSIHRRYPLQHELKVKHDVTVRPEECWSHYVSRSPKFTFCPLTSCVLSIWCHCAFLLLLRGMSGRVLHTKELAAADPLFSTIFR